MPILAPNYAIESSICSYLTSLNTVSGSMLSGSNISIFTGINNGDKNVCPCVIVEASDCREVVPFSRNYEFNVKVMVMEMAADTTSLGTLAEAVFNEFVDNQTASSNFSNPAFNISVYMVQTMGINQGVEGDALFNIGEFRIVGGMHI